jgi:hypothetical protein
MILVTHGIVGGAIGAATGSLPLAAALAFVSHLVLDMIPHWDYQISSVSDRKGTVDTKINVGSSMKMDVLKVATDGLLGLFVPVLTAYLLGLPLFIVFIAAGFAILPDFLTFVYFKTHTKYLKHFTRLHIEIIHSKIRIEKKPVLGLSLQSIFWVLAVVSMTLI